jgi:hypothetical protein
VSKVRPIAMIQHDLDTALAYQASYAKRPPAHELVQQMRDANEREIMELRAELAEALSGDLEISLDGHPVQDHRVSIAYFNRVTESLQAAYRSVFRTLSPDGRVRRGEASLSIAGTSPGSFKVALKAPMAQLDLLDDPLIDRAMVVIVELLQAAADGREAPIATEWAARASEAEVRSMIRVASAMASSQGTTKVRWRGVGGAERIVEVPAAAARNLAVALAGKVGREVIVVTGHLQMAQDEPPRVRIRAGDDDHYAAVNSPDMLDRVKSLLFDEVRATLVIDMRTSPTSGTPGTTTELMDLEPA